MKEKVEEITGRVHTVVLKVQMEDSIESHQMRKITNRMNSDEKGRVLSYVEHGDLLTVKIRAESVRKAKNYFMKLIEEEENIHTKFW